MVVIPIRHRAHRVTPVVESVHATCDARVLVAVNPDDEPVICAVDAVGVDRIAVDWQSGDYARKVNAAYRASDEDLIFLGADDLCFHPGWLEAAVAQLRPGIGVVGTNDLGNPRVKLGQHATHSLVTRAYADGFGTIDRCGEILHEGYVHEFVDDELVGTAKRRAAWAFAADSIVEHLHPNWGKAPTDPFYDNQASRLAASRRLYAQRSRLWT